MTNEQTFFAGSCMNTWYPKWKEARLKSTAGAALDGDVRVVLLDSAKYSYSVSDEFLSDIPRAARVAISDVLKNKTYKDGVFDADDITLVAVKGPRVEAVALFVNSGSASTSRLVLYIDQVNGLPITPDGKDASVIFNELGIAVL